MTDPHLLPGRRVRIDCGANRGLVLAEAAAVLPGFEHIAFEANPQLIPALRGVAARLAPVRVVVRHAAVWVEDGTVDLFLSDGGQDPLREGSTLMSGKTTYGVDYGRPVRVPSVDLDRYVRESFAEGDTVYLKVDIEGAEYAVLEKMLRSGSLSLVRALVLETHAHKVRSVSRARHGALLAALEAWGGEPAARHGTFLGWGRDDRAAAYVREALRRDARLVGASA